MPKQPSRELIHNLVQHVLWRTGTFNVPTAERPPLATRDQLIQLIETAAGEQASRQFALSQDGREWLVSVNRLIPCWSSSDSKAIQRGHERGQPRRIRYYSWASVLRQRGSF